MPLATADDVATRLGRTLTAEEIAFAEQNITMTTAQIAMAVDQDVEYVEAIDPAPEILKLICVQKAVTAGANPDGVVSESKQVGQMSRSRTFGPNTNAGVYLSPMEEALAVEAVYGKAPLSSSVRSFYDRLIDLSENRDVDELPV